MGEHGAARLERAPDRPLGRDLPPDVPLGDADDCPAPQQLPVGLEDPAIGRIGAGERDDLLDEAADDGLEMQVAGENLRGLDQRLLLAEALLVLAQEPRRVDGEPDLPRHGLRQRDLACLPGHRLGTVEAENPDQAVEEEDRRGQRRPRPEVEQGLRAPERRVAEDLAVGGDVFDRDGAPLARSEVQRREVRRCVADGLDVGRVPFREHGHRLALPAEPDETARHADGLGRLLDGDLEHRVEVELRADAQADLRDEPLAVEGRPQRLRRACPAERESRLARETLHDVDLRLGEIAVARRAHDDEHACDLALRDERDERSALRGDRVGEPPVDVRGGRDVVHGQGLARVRDADDGTRVLVEVEHDLGPPVFLEPARGEPERAPRLLVDLRE